MPGTPVKFDPKEHTYWTPDGRRLPGITSVLRRAGLLYELEGNNYIDPSKGDRVHQAIHWDCLNDLDESSVLPEELPLVLNARKCRQDLELEIMTVEEPIGNEPMGYATKIDLVARWDGRIACINWKSGPEYRFHAIQSALEALCLSPAVVVRLGVYLSDKGYRLVEHRQRSDFLVAKSALTCLAWTKGASNG